MNKNVFKIFASLALIVIIALLVSLSFRLKQAGISSVTTSMDSVIVYHYDSTKHESYKTNLAPVNNFYYNTEVTIDTEAVIKDFFSKRTIIDILNNDTLEIVTIDTLYKNNILNRKQTYKLKIPLRVEKTKTITNETIKYNKGFYAGGLVSVSPSGKIFTVVPKLNFVTKKNSFGIGYDVLNKGINAEILFKVGK